MMLIAASLFMF